VRARGEQLFRTRRRSPREPRTVVAVAGLALLGLATAPAAFASLASAGPERGSPTVAPRPVNLLPDMTPLNPRQLSIQIDHGHRRLRFTAGLANIGRGPMEVRPNSAQPCASSKRHASQIIYRDVDRSHFFRRSVDTAYTRRSAGCMVFHPQHNHWHFEAAARYVVYRPGAVANILVRARKMSFCLRDSEPVPAGLGTFHQPEYYLDCGRDTPQGISTGWVDVYSSDLFGQSLKLSDRLPDGVYCLGIRVDPRNELRESDDFNNESSRPFRLHGERLGTAETDACRVGRG
jgi:Lysyl oxidase